MQQVKDIDHLFRHQYGKMVAILTKIFGLPLLETIEDAVQDTFLLAAVKWRKEIPENPEGWLTTAAKNRVVDLLRKIKAEEGRLAKLQQGTSAISIHQLFLDHEIEDSQLRMIFTACHPLLKPQDQIAFALKTIAGFSQKEIATALLLKESAVKKRLARARHTIKEQNILFTLPEDASLTKRLHRVHEVIYLIFNEGFHSNQKELLIQKDLCGEAIRLCKILLKKETYRTGEGYALFALLCFHTSRLESKTSKDGKILTLEQQNRALWFKPLIQLGKDALSTSFTYSEITSFHLEASIAYEHVKATSFATTNWEKIYQLYKSLEKRQSTAFTQLNIAIVLLQLQDYKKVWNYLQLIDPKALEQRAYLYFATLSEYYYHTCTFSLAISSLEKALEMTCNKQEKDYLLQKKATLEERLHKN